MAGYKNHDVRPINSDLPNEAVGVGHHGVPYTKHEPTEKSRGVVETMIALGMSQRVVALEMGISVHKLRKHYRKELDVGSPRACMRVAKTLYEAAVGDPERGIEPNIGACQYWLSRRGGWSEKTTMEHTGPNGEALQAGTNVVVNQYDFSGMDLEKAKAMREEILKARNGGTPTP